MPAKLAHHFDEHAQPVKAVACHLTFSKGYKKDDW